LWNLPSEWGCSQNLGYNLEDVTEPIAGDDVVIVRVLAASAFIGDWHVVTGLPYAIRAVSGLRAPKMRLKDKTSLDASSRLVPT
jgi:hypothetical protein